MLIDKINFYVKATKTVICVGNRVGNLFFSKEKGLIERLDPS
jgi:hypothetical protein